jgi:hypothetical protein
MKLRPNKSTARHGESGQVLTEAALGLSLLSLTWILVCFTSFMATNHIRTTMAARYAAWYRGEFGRAPTTDQLEQYFFYQGLVDIQPTEPVGMLDLYADLRTLDQVQLTTAADASGPNRTTVTFGVSNLQSPESDQFPFVLLKTRLPFMPESAPESLGILKVSSSCQWEETGKPWNDPKEAVSYIWQLVKAEVSKVTDYLLRAL